MYVHYENYFNISLDEYRDFFGNFLLRHPPKFPSFSHVAILRAYVRPQMTTDIPEPLYITQKLTLTVKRIKEY